MIQIIKDKVKYRSIPGQVRCFITIGGRFMMDGKCVAAHISQNGYYAIRHKIEGLSPLRHRLVAMAWKELPENYKELDVNHLDNTPGNDWASNLEWCTRSENIAHGVDQGRYHNIKVFVREALTGDIREHASIARAATNEGVDMPLLIRGLEMNEIYHYPKLPLQFCKCREALENKIEYTRQDILDVGKPILVNIATGEKTTMSSVSAIGNSGFAGMCRPTLIEAIHKYGSNFAEGKRIDFDVYGEIMQIGPGEGDRVRITEVPAFRPLRVYDIIAGTEETYASIKEAARALPISDVSVGKNAKYGGDKVYKPHHRFTHDMDYIFQTTIGFKDIVRISSVKLVDIGTNEILIDENSTRDYAAAIQEAGYGSESGSRRFPLYHLNKMRWLGRDIIYTVNGTSFVTDDYKTVRKI